MANDVQVVLLRRLGLVIERVNSVDHLAEPKKGIQPMPYESEQLLHVDLPIDSGHVQQRNDVTSADL